MKQRLFSNWTFARALYILLGTFVLVQSVITVQWFGILLGGYFVSMGLFAFGCAAGNCSNNNRHNEPRQQLGSEEEIKYEEIK